MLDMLDIISFRVVDKSVENRVNKVCDGSVNMAVVQDYAGEVAEDGE